MLEWKGDSMRAAFNCTPREWPGNEIKYVRWYANDNDYGNYLSSDNHLANVSLHTCEVEAASGVWRVERIGPFVSTGGYDWWQFSWRNALRLEDFATPAILAHWTGPVLPDGTPLMTPPIHQHHSHLNPAARYTYDDGLLRVVEHHGDWQFTGEGARSFGQTYGGASKVVESVSLDAELNDIRRAGSPPLIWYYEMSALVRDSPPPDAPVLSLHRVHGPGLACEYQWCSFKPFLVPATEDTFTVYGGSIPHGGTLMGIVFHSHQAAFHGVVLLEGEYSALEGTALASATPFQVTPTAWTAVVTNAALEEHLLRRLKERLICHSSPSAERLGGEWYDRASIPVCAPWQFEDGVHFTAVTMNGATQFGGTSEFVRMHAGWYMTYAAADDQSHWSQTGFRHASIGGVSSDYMRQHARWSPDELVGGGRGPSVSRGAVMGLLVGVSAVLMFALFWRDCVPAPSTKEPVLM